MNVSYNCVDRHVEQGRGAKIAFHWEGEPDGERRDLSYEDLQREVVAFANALKELGVGKGTAVAIYMGMVPELPIAMLACTRIGARTPWPLAGSRPIPCPRASMTWAVGAVPRTGLARARPFLEAIADEALGAPG